MFPIVAAILLVYINMAFASHNENYWSNTIEQKDTIIKPKKPTALKTEPIQKSKNTNVLAVKNIDTTLVTKKLLKDTVPVLDSLKMGNIISKIDSLKKDTVRIDSFTYKITKDTLEAPVTYSGKDSAIFLIKKKNIKMYGNAETEYLDVKLAAPTIEINQATNILSAQSSKDTLGQITTYAKMVQAGQEYQSESMEYNFKTQKGLTRGTITQQGEMFLHADIVKKVDANTMYGLGNFFTTCNLDHPHFGFRAKRAKIVNKKLAVTGAVRPEFDSVPIPIYLPFGFYPLSQGRKSGILAPTFETNDQLGLGLNGMGYYFAINDYWDVRADGYWYSYGTWSARVNPTYRKIYKYSGNLGFTYTHSQYNFKSDPDYNAQKSYQILWSHSSDMRSRPGTSFSANVNYSSSNYNSNIPNNNIMRAANTASSSITYSKTWQDKPFNFTAGMSHSQNNQNRLMNINLPNMAFTVNTIYPFKSSKSAGTSKWYDQLGIGYSGSFNNQINFYDSIKYKKEKDMSFLAFAYDTMQWGARHSIPISLSLPPILGGAITLSPGISYANEWVDRKVNRFWKQNVPIIRRIGNYNNFRDTLIYVDTIVANVNKGFAMKHSASFSLGFNTALYGTFQSKNKNSNIQAIRHVMRPNVSLSYTPDLTGNNNWDYVQIDGSGQKSWFNKLDGNASDLRGAQKIYSREFMGLNFGIDNNLEMKKRLKRSMSKDTSSAGDSLRMAVAPNEQAPKIRLIEGFGISGSYNFKSDSMNLSDINIYFRTNLFEKINITSSATLTPYKLNEFASRTKQYAWKGGKFSLGSITNANMSLSTSFQSKPKDAKKEADRKKTINDRLNDPLAQRDQQLLLEDMRNNPANYVDFNTQWQVSLSFNLSYSKIYDNYLKRVKGDVRSGAQVSGSFNLTPKWNLNVSSSYDFGNFKIETLTFAIARDLHCWQMAINVAPIGYVRYFNFTISPKASILQDLKINRNRSFYNN